MLRREFLSRATAFAACVSLGLLVVGREPRGLERPLYRNSTEGSAKWKTGQHNAGCVLYAPDDECICREFEENQAAKNVTDRLGAIYK